jgi:hypothetical protein
MSFKTTYSQYDNKVGLISTEGPLDLTTIPSNENKILASDGAVNDFFGNSVAIGSGRIVVGARADTVGANANQGSAYIFDLAGTQLAKITASDGAAADNFGRSVAVGKGRIVVGAYADNSDQGSAYIFDMNGTELAKITASDGVAGDNFGYSVTVGSGRIVVGANGDDGVEGSAYIFDLEGTQLAKITASDGAGGDEFGRSVAIGNGRIVVGALGDGSYSGSAYIFDMNGTQLAKITASDGGSFKLFGNSVAVGNGRIVVGATESNQGSAYIFDLDGTQLAKITASDGAGGDYFGVSVAIGNGRIVVGAAYDDDNGSASGSVYIFDLEGTQLAKITASDGAANDEFGSSVAIGNGRIVVGASVDADNGSNSGSAYIYETPNIKDYFNILE